MTPNLIPSLGRFARRPQPIAAPYNLDQFSQQGVDPDEPPVSAEGNTATQEGAQEPRVLTDSAFDPTPYMDRIHQTQAALQGKLDEIGSTNYTPQQHGLGYRIAEGLTGLISPGLSHAIFEQPEERRHAKFEADIQQSGRQMGALQNAASDAIREMSAAQTGDLDRRKGAYYDTLANRQPKPDTLDIQYSQAVQDAIDRGVDPTKDSKVNMLADAIRNKMRDPQPHSANPYDDYASGDPERMSRAVTWEKATAQAKQDAKPAKEPKVTPPAITDRIERDKHKALNDADAKYHSGEIDGDELTRLKQAAQDEYESRIEAAGGGAEHFEYPSEPTRPQPAAGKGPLTAAEAKQYLVKAGGDKNKARQLATNDGRTF